MLHCNVVVGDVLRCAIFVMWDHTEHCICRNVLGVG